MVLKKNYGLSIFQIKHTPSGHNNNNNNETHTKKIFICFTHQWTDLFKKKNGPIYDVVGTKSLGIISNK